MPTRLKQYIKQFHQIPLSLLTGWDGIGFLRNFYMTRSIGRVGRSKYGPCMSQIPAMLEEKSFLVTIFKTQLDFYYS